MKDTELLKEIRYAAEHDDLDEIKSLLGIEEDNDCPSCDGVGELPGSPSSNCFPACPACGGTGNAE